MVYSSMKEKEQSSFFRNGYQSNLSGYFSFFNSTGNNEKDASCSKQDLFKFCDKTALNLTLKIFTWKEILKIKPVITIS